MKRNVKCVICGKAFTPKHVRQRACCSAHSRIWQQMSREKRARLLGIKFDKSINIKSLIERDGLTCAICGLDCLPLSECQSSYDPLKPSIDHIVPFSRGGDHVWSNVQIAHLSCNNRKGDETICSFRWLSQEKRILHQRVYIQKMLNQRSPNSSGVIA